MACCFCNRPIDVVIAVALTEKGCKTINEISDCLESSNIHVTSGQRVHVKCRLDYTRRPAANKSVDENKNPTVAARRSGSPIFNLKVNRQSTITENVARMSISEDEWGKIVLSRIEFARDLHAVDAVYHNSCNVNFRTGKQIPKGHDGEGEEKYQNRTLGRRTDTIKDAAFLKVARFLEDNDEEQLTIYDLVSLMEMYLEDDNEAPYSNVHMKARLHQHFGNEIAINSINNQNVVTFRETTASIISDLYKKPKGDDSEVEKAKIIQIAARLIKMQKYGRSAAVHQGTDIPSYTPDKQVQYIADNVDHNTRTLDGSGTFHDMGIIAVITPSLIGKKLIPKRDVTSDVVFDGYESGRSTKDSTHERRSSVCGPSVEFDGKMVLRIKKDVFLSNPANKQRFIYLLGDKLQRSGYTVLHAPGDADLAIVETAIQSAKTTTTALVGEDTDLLILLCHYADANDHDILFMPQTKQKSGTMRVWNIKNTVEALGPDICKNIMFAHAILGCDTTSALYGLGKGLSLKMLTSDATLLELIRCNSLCSCLNGIVGAVYHSLRVYQQVQQWRGLALPPEDCGLKEMDGKLPPQRTLVENGLLQNVDKAVTIPPRLT
ncbi:predicted protein [Nematostella vectensis]|uniref:Uncharacterized protein n=1 Tax=Nematostella vectensis TaxID=45351 RepID=A7RFU5_NEMVE|nr:predicted protein [Nematostella vectensis]|eukprot:XP_001641843.1 predicted protein [Nematostella vectensis]